MSTIVQRLGLAVKAAVTSFSMTFGGGYTAWGSFGAWNLFGREPDYSVLVGDGRSNSIIFATLAWVGRKFPEGELALNRIPSGGEPERIWDHPFLALLGHPNDFYTSSTMNVAMSWDWMLDGNAYAIIERGLYDRPIRMWYIPSYMMEPISEDENVFIEYYRYTPGGKTFKLRPSDVFHWRNGIDPLNPRKGLSRLKALYREIYSDDEAARWTAAMLKNSGVVGVVISPDGETRIGPPEAEAMKSSYMDKFSGAHRGEPLVSATKIKIERLSWSPAEMNLEQVRRLPEERVTAVLGVPAIVAGLGAGLDSSSFNNLSNLREQAVEDTLLPMYKALADELKLQLMREYPRPEQYQVFFDTSQIRELQPDADKLVARETAKLQAGGITLNQYLRNVGEQPLEGADDILYVPTNLMPTRVADLIPEAPPVAALPAPSPLPALAAASAELLDLEVKTTVKSMSVVRNIGRARDRLGQSYKTTIRYLLERERDAILAALDEAKGDARAEFKLDPRAFLERFVSAFEAEFRSLLERVHLVAAQAVHTEVADWLDIEDIPIDVELRRTYVADAGLHIKDITAHTLEGVRSALHASTEAGEDHAALTERIKGLGVFSDGRAGVIARTELATATNRASLGSYHKSGMVDRIRIHDGTDHDSECADLDGQEMTLVEASAVAPVEHPNCLVGDTEVVAPHLRASFARRFDGEVVVLETAEHDLLTCTPNHPVLTSEGWRAAGDLVEGDDVIRCLDVQGIAHRVDPDHDHAPALIEQVANALGPSFGGSTATMPATAEDFHGDASDGDVYVVRTHGFADLARRDPLEKLTVERANVALAKLDALGATAKVLKSPVRSADGVMRRGAVGLADLGAQPLIPQSVCIGRGSGQPGGAEPLSDYCGGDVQKRPHLLGAELLVDVQRAEPVEPWGLGLPPTGTQREAARTEMAHDGRLPEADAPGEIMRRFAGLVAPVQLVKVNRRDFHGHVYNLETAEHWYVAGNILTHNCVRTFEPILGRRKATTNGHAERAELVAAG